MTPPPTPATLSGTVVEAVAKLPSGAAMLASVGSGPRRCSVAAVAVVVVAATVAPAIAIARTTPARARRAGAPGRVGLVLMDPPIGVPFDTLTTDLITVINPRQGPRRRA